MVCLLTCRHLDGRLGLMVSFRENVSASTVVCCFGRGVGLPGSVLECVDLQCLRVQRASDSYPNLREPSSPQKQMSWSYVELSVLEDMFTGGPMELGRAAWSSRETS